MKPATGKYKFLKRPDYFSPGLVLCKLCGTEIAGFVGVGRRKHFEHHGNYREVKIQCEDVVYNRKGDVLRRVHVTNCCADCLPQIADNPEILQELLDADLDEMVKTVPVLREKLGMHRAKTITDRTNRAEALA